MPTLFILNQITVHRLHKGAGIACNTRHTVSVDLAKNDILQFHDFFQS